MALIDKAITRTLQNEYRRQTLKRTLATRRNSRTAIATGTGSVVSSAGQSFPASGVGGVAARTPVAVRNAGRLSNAVYVPDNASVARQSIVVVGNGGGGGGGGGSLAAGHGISIIGDTVSVKLLPSMTAMQVDASGLAIANAIAGSGLTINPTSKVMAVGAGFGITVSADAVAVNQAMVPTWTGTHTFNADPQIDANMDFVGGSRTINATEVLTIQPTDDLYLSPGLNVVVPMPTPIRTPAFTDSALTGITGFNNNHLGGNVRYLRIGAIKTDNLYARYFTADETRVTRGGEIWSRSYGIVEEDFVLPADEATVDVWFEEAPELEDAKLFVAGNWLVARIIDLDGPQILSQIFFQVVDADGAGTNDYIQRQDAGGGPENEKLSRQQWRLRRKSGGVTGQTIKKGVTLVDLGVVGQGAVSLTALAQNDGPYVQTEIFKSIVGDRPQYEAKTRMGNLKSTVDYGTDVYGFATGNNLGLLPSAGFSGMASDEVNGLRLFNTDIEIYDATALVVKVSKTDGIKLIHDTNLQDNEYTAITWQDNLESPGSSYSTITSYTGLTGGITFFAEAYAGPDDSVIALVAVGGNNTRHSAISVQSATGISITPENGILTVAGHITSGVDVERDLGTASFRYRTLYVQQVIADTISGATMAGSQWEHPGSMVIDANSASNTIVSITNQGAGVADLSVDRDIILGGLVDGVDVADLGSDFSAHMTAYAAHIINVNAHHARDHVLATGTGLGATHTISGAAAGQVLRATGATAARFAQLQHDDLGSVTPDQHHARLHNIISDNDHSIVGSPFQIVGATATNVLGLLTPSSNPGAAAAILRTDINGGIVLQHLTVEGDVQVTHNGQLVVAGGVGGAHGIIMTIGSTPENSSVGFGRVPDQQFRVDVDGPLRADYLIGKHAIQLDGAVMICQYDGHLPYETNFSGQMDGHRGQRGIPSGNVIFREGIFEKAVQLGPGTTNLITNPSFEVNASGWSSMFGGVLTARIGDVRGAYIGNGFLWVATDDDFQGARYPNLSLTNGQSYTFSVYVRHSTGTPKNWLLRLSKAGVGQAPLVEFTPTDDWQRVSITFVCSATASDYALDVYTDETGFHRIDLDAVQAEQNAFLTPYHDGSMTVPTTWNGSAHASTSTRTFSYITYPTGLPDTYGNKQMTVMAWIKPSSNDSYRVICSKTNAGNTSGWELVNSSGALRVILRNPLVDISGGALEVGEWNFVAFTYDRTTLRLYLNGVEVGNAAATQTTNTTDAFLMGRRPSGNLYNGLIDCFAATDQAEDAKRILSVYESQAPVFAESSVFSFRATPRGLVWADDEGLWMRDFNGNNVFGIYGGEAASKSWGGVSLGIGDLLIGRSPDAYLHWDTSANQLFLHRVDITLNDGINNRGELTRVGNLTLGTDITTTNGKSFQVISQGADAGDVIIGRLAGNHLHWDQQAGTLHVVGDLLIEDSSYLTEEDLADSPTITGINADITIINSDLADLNTAVTDTLPDAIGAAQSAAELYGNERRIVRVIGSWRASGTDTNTVAWSGVSIRTAAGANKSVNNGNTGNMTGQRWLHCNLGAAEPLTLSVADSATSIPAGNTVVAVCTPSTDPLIDASAQVVGGATYISGDQIITGGIVAANIKAASITGDRIFGTTLSSIKSETGNLTVTGNISVGTSGAIRSGIKEYGSGAGFWLGYDDGEYKFDVGDGGANRILWNGTSLELLTTSPINISRNAGGAMLTFSSAGGTGNLLFTYPNISFNQPIVSPTNATFQEMFATKFTATGDVIRIATSRTVASHTSLGLPGEICWDATYFYLCVGTNQWRRQSLFTGAWEGSW